MHSIECHHLDDPVCASILLAVGQFAKQTNMENVSCSLKILKRYGWLSMFDRDIQRHILLSSGTAHFWLFLLMVSPWAKVRQKRKRRCP